MKTTFQVWYMKPEFFRAGILGDKTADPDNLEDTHVHLKDIGLENGTLEDLENVYVQMQGEVWSPIGEARDLIMSKGLRHTSMSVGDVIVVKGEVMREIFSVAGLGFKNLRTGKASP